MTERVLIINGGSLRDFIAALGAMEALRRHHAAARIALLTTWPSLDIAQRSGYFNDVIVDPCPEFYQFSGWYALFKKLGGGGFTHVYDLQQNRRSALYLKLFLRKAEWFAIEGMAAHVPDISWMTSDIGLLGLKKPFVLLFPGGEASRWPENHYSALALRLARDGYQPVILGAEDEAEVNGRIALSCPEALDLSGKTSLYDIAAMAREAVVAIGNDTVPTHLAALAQCPTIALLCMRDPERAFPAPAGKSVRVIEAEDLDELPVAEVYKKIQGAPARE